MPLARIGQTLLYFAHIPKAGGSSIVSYLRSKGPLSLITHTAVGGLGTSAQHLERALFDELVPRAFYDHGFTVLRDPVARMVSEFRYRARPPRGLLGRGEGVAAMRFGGRTRNLSFDRWVDAVLREYDRDPYVHGNHIRPQVEFVHPDHKVFLFEHGLDPLFDWVDAVTNTPPCDRERHEKPGSWPKPEVSPETRAKIEAFYAEDMALIERHRQR